MGAAQRVRVEKVRTCRDEDESPAPLFRLTLALHSRLVAKARSCT